MTFPEFDKYQAGLLEEVLKMKSTKGREYATDGKDRFQNFNEEAKDMDVPRLKVAEIFLNKHMRAIKAYIRNGGVLSNEHIQGRIVDAITYLTLIGGMIAEDEANAFEIQKPGKVQLTSHYDDLRYPHHNERPDNGQM